jgi:hypothetical protein
MTEGSLNYSDGIAAARTLIALEANTAALQRRLPEGWEVAPYAGDDLRGKSLMGANLLLPFHEVFAVRSHSGKPDGMPQLSYLPFISQARNTSTGALGHVHWLLYTEDPAGIPGKYRDAKLARITRSQTFTKEARGETHVRETFSAVAESGEVHLSLAYRQGGEGARALRGAVVQQAKGARPPDRAGEDRRDAGTPARERPQVATRRVALTGAHHGHHGPVEGRHDHRVRRR